MNSSNNITLEDRLIKLASNSDMKHSYGAVIYLRNEIIGTGYNYSTCNNYNLKQCILCSK